MQRALSALLALASTLVGGCGSGPPPVPRRELPVTQFTFPSGLQVVVEYDRSAPLVGVVAVVEAGGGDEPANQDGLAHLVEHLMFESRDVQGRSLFERFDALGAAAVNASTGVDTTEVHAFAPRAAARALLRASLDAVMTPLADIDQAAFNRARGVVKEEIAERASSSSAHAALRSALFPAGHPGRRLVSGTAETLDRLTLEQARAFVAAHYRPERVTVLIAGDIPYQRPEELLVAVPRPWRGDPAHRVAPQRRPVTKAPPPERQAAGPTTLESADIAVPEVWVGWTLPAEVPHESFQTSLVEALVDLAANSGFRSGVDYGMRGLSFGYYPGPRASALFGRMVLSPEASPMRVAGVVIDGVESVWRLGRLTSDELKALRLSATMELAATMDTLTERAVPHALFVHRSLEWKDSDILSVGQGGVADLPDLLGRYLKPDRATVVVLRPRRGAPVAVQRVGTGVGGAVLPAADRSQGASPRAPSGDRTSSVARRLPPPSRAEQLAGIVPTGSGRAVVSRLSNGLQTIILPQRARSLVSVMLGFYSAPDAQRWAAPAAAAGWAKQSLWTGRYIEAGILADSFSWSEASIESMRALPLKTEEALTLMDLVRGSTHIKWPTRHFISESARRRAAEARPRTRAHRELMRELWGDDVHAVVPTTDDLARTAWPQVSAWVGRTERPDNGALVIVGDVDEKAVARQIEAHLGGWVRATDAGPAPKLPPPAPLRTSGAPRVLQAAPDGNGQTRIQIGCRLPHAQSVRQDAVNDLLGAVLREHLFDRLRRELGAAYSPSASTVAYRNGAAALYMDTEVGDKDAAAVWAALGDVLERGASLALRPAAVDWARWNMIRAHNVGRLGNEALAYTLLAVWTRGWSPASVDEWPRALVDVTLPEVTAALQVCVANAVVSVATGAALDLAAHR